MTSFFALLALSSSAAEIRVETYDHVRVLVDDTPIPLVTESHAARATDLVAGEHVVSIVTKAGELLANRRFSLSVEQKLRLAWIDDTLVLTRTEEPEPDPLGGAGIAPSNSFSLDRSVGGLGLVSPGPYAMPQTDFDTLRRELERLEYRTKKLDRVQAESGSYFTMKQLSALLKQFEFSDDKLDVARMLAGHVVDPENVRELDEQFNFSTTRDEVRQLFQ